VKNTSHVARNCAACYTQRQEIVENMYIPQMSAADNHKVEKTVAKRMPAAVSIDDT